MNNQPLLVRLSDNKEFELGLETTIGRRQDCTIVLEESGASRFHAQIIFFENKLTIEDFSRNGTEVNGIPIKGIVDLQHEDSICFDQEKYQIYIPVVTLLGAESKLLDPANSVIADDAIRRPFSDSPPPGPSNPHRTKFYPSTNTKYDPLDHRKFSMPSLVVRNGKNPGIVYTLQDSELRWKIGSKAQNNDIHIDDKGVSEYHAVIHRAGDSWEIIDQMSTNVLRVNESNTNKSFLQTGDKISLGPIDCEFVLPDGYHAGRKNTQFKFLKTTIRGIVILLVVFTIFTTVYFFRNHAW